MNKDSKIYVAGHRGLVGSAIWNHLQKRGYSNLVGKSSSELDLRDRAAVKAFFDQTAPEYVFLAAAKVGGIMANSTYRADFIYDNLQIQQNVIGESFSHGVKKLLFLGSTCIYPQNAPQPIKEDSLLTSELEYTNEPYAIAKIAGLKLCESFNIQYQTDYIAVMPTNLYGYGDNFDLERSHVLPALLRKIHLGHLLETGSWDSLRNDLAIRPIEQVDGTSSKPEILSVLNRYGIRESEQGVVVEIWGSGTPLREFLWSEDMAEASVFVMERVSFNDLCGSTKEIRNCHLNVGSGREISIKELAQFIKNRVGFKGTFYFNSDKPDGTMRKVIDVSKLKSLGWSYSVEIEDGIGRLYDWYKKVHGNV